MATWRAWTWLPKTSMVSTGGSCRPPVCARLSTCKIVSTTRPSTPIRPWRTGSTCNCVPSRHAVASRDLDGLTSTAWVDQVAIPRQFRRQRRGRSRVVAQGTPLCGCRQGSTLAAFIELHEVSVKKALVCMSLAVALAAGSTSALAQPRYGYGYGGAAGADFGPYLGVSVGQLLYSEEGLAQMRPTI